MKSASNNHPHRSLKKNPRGLNLVQSWLDATLTPGMTKSDAIRMHLNAACGEAYTPQILGKWLRGDRSIPQSVQNYMLKCVICYVLENEIGSAMQALDAAALDRIAQRLSPPPRRGGSV